MQEDHLRCSAHSQDLPSWISKEVGGLAAFLVEQALEQQIASDPAQFCSTCEEDAFGVMRSE